MKRIRAIAFDAVGTLLHPDPPAPMVYANVGHRFGSRLQPEEILARFRAAFRKQDEIDVLAGLRTSEAREVERWRSIVGEVLDDVSEPEACFRQLFDHFRRPAAWRCEPGVGAILRSLKAAGFGLAMASNLDDRLHTVAAGLPELEPIDHLVISSEVGWRKPAPAFFAGLSQRLNQPPPQILLVGDDWENDYLGARAAGCQAVLLGQPPVLSTDVQWLNELRDLPDWLRQKAIL